MKRKDLVIGQKYIVYAANSWNSTSKGQCYFDENSWGQPQQIEIVDTAEYRSNIWYWNEKARKKDIKERKWKPSQLNPSVSVDGHEKSQFRNVLAKSIIEDSDKDGTLITVPLNSIRFPVCVWKRRSMGARMAEQNRERDAILEEIKQNSLRRHWLRTEGKQLKNNLRKAARKCGFEVQDIPTFEEGLSHITESAWEQDWRSEKEVIYIPKDIFMKLLELAG